MEGFILLIIWVGLSVGVGLLAGSRGRSALGFGLLALVTSPILGLIVVLVIKDLNAEAAKERFRREESERQERLRQREHEKQLESIRAISGSKAAAVNAPSDKTCPFCAETIKAAAIKCKHCGSDLPPSPSDAPAETAVAAPPPPKRIDGVCPACLRACALDAVVCESCGATFGEGATSKPRRRQLGEVVRPPLKKSPA